MGLVGTRGPTCTCCPLTLALALTCRYEGGMLANSKRAQLVSTNSMRMSAFMVCSSWLDMLDVIGLSEALPRFFDQKVTLG